MEERDGAGWRWLLAMLVIVALLVVVNALPDSGGSEPVSPGPRVVVTQAVSICADQPDFVVIGKSFSSQYTNSSVTWCQRGWPVKVDVSDDAPCLSKARVGRRRPAECEAQ